MARLLILGGTAEAAELAARLAGDARLETVTSLAGLTRMPGAVAGRMRRGGFGGAEGLAAFLKEERYDALIDATHPFAARIAINAAKAAESAGVKRLKLLRGGFRKEPGDQFVPVADVGTAAAVLPRDARVFVAAGRRELAPFADRTDLWCLVRMIEPPSIDDRLPRGEVVLGQPPLDPEKEVALLRKHRIGWVVSKNSGGRAAGSKIVAARRLKIPVMMVERPPAPAGPMVETIEDAVAWVEEAVFGARTEV
jgi:precorrin-6A/cobalt-precorrin-6A reductase